MQKESLTAYLIPHVIAIQRGLTPLQWVREDSKYRTADAQMRRRKLPEQTESSSHPVIAGVVGIETCAVGERRRLVRVFRSYYRPLATGRASAVEPSLPRRSLRSPRGAARTQAHETQHS